MSAVVPLSLRIESLTGLGSPRFAEVSRAGQRGGVYACGQEGAVTEVDRSKCIEAVEASYVRKWRDGA